MTDLMRRGPGGLKEDTKRSDPKHMEMVADLPCCICSTYRLPQMSPTQVHHCIHGRYSTRRSPDRATIPLCEGHHQGDFDRSKIALHRHPAEWKNAYGEDSRWLRWVEVKIKEMKENTI